MSNEADAADTDADVVDRYAGVTSEVGEVDTDDNDGGEGDDDGQAAEPGEGEEDAAGDGAGGEDEGSEQGAEGEEATASEDKPSDAPKPRKPAWERRIDSLVKQNSTTAAELAAAREKIAALESDKSGTEGVKFYTQEEFDAGVQAAATEKAAVNETTTKMEALWDTGVKTHKDFDQRVEAYVKAFGPEELSKRPDFFQAVTDLPNGHDVLYELGGDLDRMAAVLELPPYKMGIELARLSEKLAKPKDAPLSRVAAPIKPLEVANNSVRDINDPKISMEEYARLRQEAWAKKNGGGR